MKRRAPLLVLALATSAAWAQNPFFEAARGAVPAAPAPEVPAATALVRTFVDGCLAHEGDSIRTVDWAINAGMEPIDAFGGAGATVLGGQPGTVFTLPGSAGQVLLAIDVDKRCTVWAERADGPALRAEFLRALGALAGKGARVQPLAERTVERAGAWRQQVQLRYRRVGGSQDLGVGAVTTLTAEPTVQVLSAAPIASRLDAPATDPTGQPIR